MNKLAIKTTYVFLLFLVFFISRPEYSFSNDIAKAKSILYEYPDSAFVVVKSILANEYISEQYMAAAHLIIAEIFFINGLYQHAQSHLQTAKELFMSNKDILGTANANLLHANLLHYLKQPHQSLQYYKTALGQFKESNNENGIAAALAGIGHFYEKNGLLDSALLYQYKALDRVEKTNDQTGKAKVLESLGSIYEDLEAYEKAIVYFESALKIHKKNGFNSLMPSVLNNIGDVYRKIGNQTNSLEYYQQAITLARRYGDKYQLSSAYKDISKSYYIAGNFEAAYDNLEKGRKLYETIYTENTLRQIANNQVFFETQAKENEIKILNLENKYTQQQLFMALASLILFLVIATLVIYMQKLKIEKQKNEVHLQMEINAANDKIAKIAVENNRLNEVKLKAEIENQRLKEEALQHELEFQKKSFTAQTLHLIDKNEKIKRVKGFLNVAKENQRQLQKREINHVIKEIESSISNDTNWNHLKLILSDDHEKFKSLLLEKTPNLTDHDFRLCILTKMGLSSKEVASILGITADSLRIARHRIKKKLGLESETNLTTYLREIEMSSQIS